MPVQNIGPFLLDNLKGKTTVEAEAYLASLMLPVTYGPRKTSDVVKGLVESTNPPAGSSVPSGTPITIFLSAGSLIGTSGRSGVSGFGVSGSGVSGPEVIAALSPETPSSSITADSTTITADSTTVTADQV